jgi:hypothetical protein
MATLPGLPMFGHGQIEGFTEKYGMEYQRPRYDETPTSWLVERHEREIAPLLKRRSLFAESSQLPPLRLLPTTAPSTKTSSPTPTATAASAPWSSTTTATAHPRHHRFSAAYADKGAGQLRQQRLREGLGLSDTPLPSSPSAITHRPRIPAPRRRNFRPRPHPRSPRLPVPRLSRLARAARHRPNPGTASATSSTARGVPSLDDALVRRQKQRKTPNSAQPVLRAGLGSAARRFLREAQTAYVSRSEAIKTANRPPIPVLLGTVFRERLRAAMRLPAIEALFPTPWTAAARRVLPSPSPQFTATAMWGPVLAWCVLELLAESIDAATQKP